MDSIVANLKRDAEASNLDRRFKFLKLYNCT